MVFRSILKILQLNVFFRMRQILKITKHFANSVSFIQIVFKSVLIFEMLEIPLIHVYILLNSQYPLIRHQ